jgi:tetratricopeptide (TPR) repeat protein
MSKKKKQHQQAVKSATSHTEPKWSPDTQVQERWILAGCLALTFAVFANTLGAGFVNWDDHGYLWLNPAVKPLGSMDLGQIFSTHTHGNYSPLVVLSFCIEHTFDVIKKPGEMVADNFQPFLYHFDNVLLHLGATALAFFFLRALGVRGWGLAFGTALFGIHPMRAESVAWVTERKDVLYGLFYIASLLAYWKYITENKAKYYGLALLLGLLSLFSKIQAVSLPLSMLALDWLAGRDLKNIKVWVEKVPFFALSLVFGLVGIQFLSQAEGFKDTGYSMTERFFFAAASLCRYLWKVPVPLGLSAYYPYPKVGELPSLFYAAPLALAAVVWWVWGTVKRGREVAFGFLFFLVNIIFLLQFKGAGKAFMADRFTYIPYLGLFFVLAKTYSDIELGKKLASLKTALPYLAGGFIAMCSVLTILQNNTWKSSIALWENNTSRHPQDPLSWTNLGLAYDDLQDYEKSAQAYQKAVQVDAGYFDANFNLAVALNKLKRHDEAAQWFGRAMELKPEFADSWYGRGQVWISKGDYAKAAADFEHLIKLKGEKASEGDYDALGMAYSSLGQNERAIAAFDRAIQIKPNPESLFRKGNSYASMNRMEEAIAIYDQVLALDPKYADAVNNKGNAFASLGRFAEAIAQFDKAIAMNPEAANYKFNRGMARHSSGDLAGACADWQQAALGGYMPAQGIVQQFCR